MGTNIKLPLLLFIGVGTSAYPIPYELTSTCFQYTIDENVEDWNHSFHSYNFVFPQEYRIWEKSRIIVSFSKNLFENSIDLDPEFVEIVDKHFWDLI